MWHWPSYISRIAILNRVPVACSVHTTCINKIRFEHSLECIIRASSIASIITVDYFKTCLYHDDQLSGRQRVGRSLKPPLVGVVTVQRSLFMHVAVATLWVVGRFSGVKSGKSRDYLRYFVSFNLFAANKDILYFAEWIAWSFTIFTAYIVFVFLACFLQRRACGRFSAWSCSLKRALYNTPDSECLECYIYRLFTLDTMQKIGVCKWVVI